MIVEGEEGVFEKDLLEVSSAGDAEGGHPSHVNGPFFSTSQNAALNVKRIRS